eukprot:COSAG01_NODE_5869_length_3981_cov_1.845183_1_plen_272_part_00
MDLLGADSTVTTAAAAAAALGAAAACVLCADRRRLSPAQLTAEQAAAARAAVVGLLVGDSAAVTSHWVYDQQVLAEHVRSLGGQEHAPFMQPINPFYHVPVGSQSCYGDQTFALLRALAAAGPGKLDQRGFMAELETLCGGLSDYGSLDRVIDKADCPIQGPWRHGSLKKYFANLAAGQPSGSDDKQIDGACKVAPVVASYAAQGLGATLAAVEATIRVTQDTDESVSMGLAFARILHSAVMGHVATAEQAVTRCIGELRDAERLQPNPLE